MEYPIPLGVLVLPLPASVTRDELPPCEYCEGTGEIQGPFPLECPRRMGTKTDMNALRAYHYSRRLRAMGMLREQDLLRIRR